MRILLLPWFIVCIFMDWFLWRLWKLTLKARGFFTNQIHRMETGKNLPDVPVKGGE